MRRKDLGWNLATVFVIALIPLIASLFLMVFLNPQTEINPFPPPTLPALAQPATATPAILALPPTWTPTPSLTPDYSPTPEPSLTPTQPLIIIIGTPIESLGTPEPTETAVAGGFSFMRQSDPQAISINLYDASRGCGWMGIAGRVVDRQNRPVTGIRVSLRGSLDGKSINMTSLTGTAAQYGPSGYEFTIANQPLASQGLLSVRLLDQSNLPLSERVEFDTFADCEKNLILIDFKQVR
jgi:hypothetical protein